MILQRVKNLLWYPPSERKGRPLGSYSRTFPWKTLYYRVSVCSIPPLLLGVTGALIVRGPSGLAGFMLGFLNLYMFHLRRINGVGSHPIKGWNTPGPSMCLRGESKLDGGGAPDGAYPRKYKTRVDTRRSHYWGCTLAEY